MVGWWVCAWAWATEPVEVHRSQLEVVSQVAPVLPADTPGGSCVATIRIEPSGATAVEAIDGCEPVAAELVRQALVQWSWAPVVVDGVAVAARTRLPVVLGEGAKPVPVAPVAVPAPVAAPEAVPDAEPVPATAAAEREVGSDEYPKPELVKRVAMTFPREARKAGFEDVRCLAQVLIDEHGVPYDIAVTECPELFHAAVRDSLFQWRWTPSVIDGEPVKVRFSVGVTFRRGKAPPTSP